MLSLFPLPAIMPLMSKKPKRLAPAGNVPKPVQALALVETPNQHSIEEVSCFFNVGAEQCLKTLIVRGENNTLVALLLRGDHELNPIKAEKIDGVLSPLQFAGDAEILAACGCKPGSIGPIGLDIADNRRS